MDILKVEKVRRRLFINIFVIAISLVGITRRDKAVYEASPFETVLIEVFAPVQKWIGNTAESVNNFFGKYVANTKATDQNIVLTQKVAELESVIANLAEINRENERLKQLLQFGNVEEHHKVLARVIAWDSSNDARVIRIDKGSKQGIDLHSTVVTAKGVVGYVYRLTRNYADVLTILDQNNRVDALIASTRTHGIVEGDSNEGTHMKYVPRNEKVTLNDSVLTSGLGDIYPKGLKVGHISKIEKESYSLVQKIEVLPGVDFSKLEEVVVLVKNTEPQKIKELNFLRKSSREGEK